jgi:hypothetical protein
LPEKGLATIQIFGDHRIAEITIFPGSPGHRPAFMAGFVFLGLSLHESRRGIAPFDLES